MEETPEIPRVLVVGSRRAGLLEAAALRAPGHAPAIELGWVGTPSELQAELSEHWDLILYDVAAAGVAPGVVLDMVRRQSPDLPVLVMPGVSAALAESADREAGAGAWSRVVATVWRSLGSRQPATSGLPFPWEVEA
jgi:hypothetical protein